MGFTDCHYANGLFYVISVQFLSVTLCLPSYWRMPLEATARQLWWVSILHTGRGSKSALQQQLGLTITRRSSRSLDFSRTFTNVQLITELSCTCSFRIWSVPNYFAVCKKRDAFYSCKVCGTLALLDYFAFFVFVISLFFLLYCSFLYQFIVDVILDQDDNEQ